jgi:hypothetical protein
VLVTDNQPDSVTMAKNLDEALKEANKNYEVARSKALKGLKVSFLTKRAYTDYLVQSKQKGGQVKTPKVMREERMKKLLKSITLHLA